MSSGKQNEPEDPVRHAGKQSPGGAVRDERPSAPAGDPGTARKGPRRRLTARQTIRFVVRLSRLGATFVRDTRESQLDASRGDFLSVDYALALRQLGSNISSQKFLANYYRFYTIGALRKTVLAANMTPETFPDTHPFRTGV